MSQYGVEVIHGDLAVDDRGAVSFVNEFSFEGVKRFYMVENHKSGFVRAWHGHYKEGKYVLVVQGSILLGVCTLDLPENPPLGIPIIPEKYVLSARKPQVLWIPPGNTNGFMTLEDDTKVMFFSTATLEESKGDDIRWHWDTFDKPELNYTFWKVHQR